jgi:hypothetical protein
MLPAVSFISNAALLGPQGILTASKILARRNRWTHLVIHKRKLTKLPAPVVVPLICGPLRGKLSCPPDLTILLIHNYPSEPVMETSLRYVGIRNFVVLRPAHEGPWSNTAKLRALKRFLDSGACTGKTILFCDSDDAILRDDPSKAVQYLQEEKCDMLLSGTSFEGGYSCMPEIREWAVRMSVANGCARPPYYINSGVYVAKTEFLREVVDAAMHFVTDQDLSREEYRRLRGEGLLGRRLPEFPKGIGSDQIILRFLHPRFYPRMKIDYRQRLALR